MTRPYGLALAIAAGTISLLASAANVPPANGADAALVPDSDAARAAFVDTVRAAAGDLARLDAALTDDILAFQVLIEEGMVFRQRLAVAAAELQEKRAASQPLSGADLDRLTQTLESGVSLTRRLFAVTSVHANWRTCTDKALAKAGVAGPPLPVTLRTKGAMLSLAGSLFLYDTYRVHALALAEDDRVRRLLNRGDAGYARPRGLLNDIIDEFLSVRGWDRVGDALRFCEENQFVTAASYAGAPTLVYLQQLIAQSPSRELVRRGLPPAKVVGEHVRTRARQVRDGFRDLGDSSTNTLSLFFGNTVGLVETRKGRLYGDAAVAERLRATLKPGDILLEKTPFRLTDTFIPGHWGHVAIWIGGEAELAALGLWDDPVVAPHRDAIRNGRGVVEALRQGVMLNTIEHFLNIDDLAVLRDPRLAAERARHHVLLALRQVGKAYDFNFDVETVNTIVCSELVYAVYTDITWPTGRTLGRYTISPDHVAAKALNGGPLQIVLFYHDGRRVEPDPLPLMALLIDRSRPLEAPPSPPPAAGLPRRSTAADR